MRTNIGKAASSWLTRSLRNHILALTLAALVAVAVPATAAFFWIVDTTILRLGTMFAERQILYDRHRGLEALRREVALAETLMRAPAIMEWAQDEYDRDKYARGIAELEHFRRTFVDRSYFFVVDSSGNYYFNDHEGAYTGAQRRYALSPDEPKDAWYYKTAASGGGCHLNVNHDEVLAVTKVWINCVVERDGKALGLVGTGIDLTHFLRSVVETNQVGVESMFVDRSGAIQASRDESLIDYHSLTKEKGASKTFLQLIDDEADREAFTQMMRQVAEDGADASTRLMSVAGHKALVGVGHLGELGWHNVTVMHVDSIVDRRLFGPIAALIALAMLSAAALVTLLFKRSVLDRLARVERSVVHIEKGDFSHVVADDRPDEIGRLARALDRMSRAVGADRATLEAAVRERTVQLERIAYVDQLSGVLNRRGFIEAYAQEARRMAPGQPRPGLVILDLDNFKVINDTYGHACGDEVIVEVARRLLDITRDEDLCARWGGDEFVVILKDCDYRTLVVLGQRLLEAVGARPIAFSDGSQLRIGTSIGAHLVGMSDTLESAAGKADLALYAAKRQGRNRLVVYDASVHGEATPVTRVA